MPRKFGHQPAKNVIASEGRTIAGFVRSLKSDHSHALLAIDGRCPPSPELRAELPGRLGLPVEALFTSSALAATYNGPSGRILLR